MSDQTHSEIQHSQAKTHATTAHEPQARQFHTQSSISNSSSSFQGISQQQVAPSASSTATTYVQPNLTRNILTGMVIFIVLDGVFGGLIWIGSRLIQSESASSSTSGKGSTSPSPMVEKSNPAVTLPTMAPMLPNSGTISATPSAKPSATPKTSPTPTATARPSASPTVSPVSSAVDLNVESIFIEDPQTERVISAGDLNAGLRIRLRAVLKNSGTQDSKIFRSYWVINGNTIGVNTNGKVGASRTAIYDEVNSLVSPEFFIKSGLNTVAYYVDTENTNNESNTANNVRSASFNSQPTKIDLSAEGVNLYELNTSTSATASAGKAMTVKVSVKNSGTDKISGFGVRLQQNNSTVAEAVYGGWLNGGQTSEVLTYNFTPSAGSTTFKIVLNADNSIQEISTANNSKEVVITAQ